MQPMNERRCGVTQEKQMNIEMQRFSRICDAELVRVRHELDSDAEVVLRLHEERMAKVIGRMLASHARKHAATASAAADPILDKIQVLHHRH